MPGPDHPPTPRLHFFPSPNCRHADGDRRPLELTEPVSATANRRGPLHRAPSHTQPSREHTDRNQHVPVPGAVTPLSQAVVPTLATTMTDASPTPTCKNKHPSIILR